MKKILFSAVAIGLFASACGAKADTATDGATSVGLDVDSISFTDTQALKDWTVTTKFDLQYLVGEQPVVKKADCWIRQTVGLGLNGTFEASAKAASDSIVADSKKEVAGEINQGYSVAPYSFEYSSTVAYRTERFITLQVDKSVYLGGAHGTYETLYGVFTIPDGSHLGWNIFSDPKSDSLLEMVKEAIDRQYFDVNVGEEDTYLLTERFVLPEQAPCFVADGVRFTYALYEIACYAAGTPTCVIPYKEIYPLLTKDAQQLIAPLI